jgi:hypothetical protein
MKIFVTCSRNRIRTFEVEPSDSINSIAQQLSQELSLPPDMMWLIFKGKRLNNSCTFDDYYVCNESYFDLYVRAFRMWAERGLQNNFATTDKADVFNQFLLGTGPAPSTAAFRERWMQEKFDQYKFMQDKRDLLSASQRTLCMRFMDALWRLKADWLVEQNNGKPVCDMKVKFTDKEGIAMLLNYRASGDSAHNSSALEQLMGLATVSNSPDWCRVAMRCTRGPTGGAIGWHFDRHYDNETLQLALNDDTEYEGTLNMSRSHFFLSCFYLVSLFATVCAQRWSAVLLHA